MRKITKWGVLWWQRGGIDGDVDRIQYGGQFKRPLIFDTRRECKEFIDKEWGYIRDRKDLRTFPHGWRLPRPIKIEIGALSA